MTRIIVFDTNVLISALLAPASRVVQLYEGFCAMIQSCIQPQL
jgi:predicted nucleic acid-binding protein